MSPDDVSLWTTIKVSVVITVALFVTVLLVLLSIVLLAIASLVVAVDRLVSGRRRDIRLGRLLVIELAPSTAIPTTLAIGEGAGETRSGGFKPPQVGAQDQDGGDDL